MSSILDRKKKGIQVSTTITIEQKEQLERIAKISGLSSSKVISRLVAEFLEKGSK